MITRAVLRYVRITPRKFRQIIPLVKGKGAEEAIAILTSVKKGASKYGIDLISSAISNARRMQGVDVSGLYISNLIANGGPMLKRFRAASMGRASMIKKRTSHITVELEVMPKESESPKMTAPKQAREELKIHGKVKSQNSKVKAAVKKSPGAK